MNTTSQLFNPFLRVHIFSTLSSGFTSSQLFPQGSHLLNSFLRVHIFSTLSSGFTSSQLFPQGSHLLNSFLSSGFTSSQPFPRLGFTSEEVHSVEGFDVVNKEDILAACQELTGAKTFPRVWVKGEVTRLLKNACRK